MKYYAYQTETIVQITDLQFGIMLAVYNLNKTDCTITLIRLLKLWKPDVPLRNCKEIIEQFLFDEHNAPF